ncbi:alpha/beta hydrolase [Pseudomonas sp. HR96]|uniref:alpha/beta hydrolase n=1 Tax=Pseudomonas sp. HR96 TaxID=1027966 RepID=UPI002A7614EE|nr:alpha/beta hydrolase [Pseudomonas sp. HR96]WPO97725.1 alpha/beta hydrolase [Pseudomonas sp. HR96]
MTQRQQLSLPMADFVEQTEAFASRDPSLAAQRQAYRRMCAAFTPARPPTLQVFDRQLGEVPVRRYRPMGAAPAHGWPWLLYLHGGGWVVGGLDSHDFICCELAQTLSATVVAVDYRLAPEHPYPAALDDCLAAWQGVLARAAGWQLAKGPGVVMGDSAGGNLAAALCLALRQRGESMPGAQVLVYPGLGGPAHSASRVECAEAPLLSASEVLDYQQLYVPEASRTDPLALPLLAENLAGLPAAFIAVAEFDPLRDDGVAYHQRLLAAGGDSRLYLGRGLVHGCLRARHQVPEVDELYAAMLGFVRAAFDRSPAGPA